jgi:hypothetical protein
VATKLSMLVSPRGVVLDFITRALTGCGAEGPKGLFTCTRVFCIEKRQTKGNQKKRQKIYFVSISTWLVY